MIQKTITISMKEYERLQQVEDLSHRQRFTIKHLERQIERMKARDSFIADRTLKILLGSGYTFEEAMLLYGRTINPVR